MNEPAPEPEFMWGKIGLGLGRGLVHENYRDNSCKSLSPKW